MSVLLVAGIPLALAVLLGAVVELERFLLFVVLGAAVIPVSLAKPGGTNIAAVDLLLLIAVAAWLVNNSLGNAPDPRLRGNPILLPAVLFVAINWISMLWSVNLHATVAKSIQLIELLLIFPIVFASLPRSVKTVRSGFLFLTALTVILAVATLASYVQHPSASVQGTYLPGFNKNEAGGFLAAGVVLSYGLHTYLRGPITRPFLFAAGAINLLGLLASGSRGSMLGAAAGVLVIGIVLRRGKIVAIAVVVTLAALYFSVVAPGITQKTALPGSYSTSALRVHIWKNALHTIRQHPILGTGEGTYNDAQYNQADPNNLFLLTWAEVGIVGLAALFFLLVRFGRLLGQARRLGGERAPLAVAAGGVAVSIFVHSQVDVSWIRGTYSLAVAMIGIMVALVSMAPEAALGTQAPGEFATTSADKPRVLEPV